MSSKKIYVVAVLCLLLITSVFFTRVNTKKSREQQHLSYNTQIEDTNLSIDADNFSSHLPVINIDTNGKSIPGKPMKKQHVATITNEFLSGEIQVFSKEDELNTLHSIPEVDEHIEVRIRGNSSRTFDKTGYLFKFLNNKNEEKPISLLGMEANSTWVLHGPYLDKTLMRNYMWYNLSGQIMDWAPDARYCEVFLNGIYQGVYVLVEQIGVGDGRIEVTKYDGRANVCSYIICVDRESVNDTAYLQNFTRYTKRMPNRIEIKYPGAKKLTSEIEEYIGKDFSEFEKSIYSYDYDTLRFGYRNYIDTDNFVDYFIINEVTQNTDAGLFSTYLYKDVAGKLKMSVWDFNNCSDNYIEQRVSDTGFFMIERQWYFMLAKDEAFTEKVIRRYRNLRKEILSDDSIKTYIHDVEAYLGPSVQRNYQVWGYSFQPGHELLIGEGREINSYDAAVSQYQNALLKRLAWMDENIELLRTYSHESRNKKYNH